MRKSIMFLAVILLVTLFPKSTYAATDDQFTIKNVYEYNNETYDKIKQYDHLNVELLSENSLSMVLDTGEEILNVTDIAYDMNYDSESNTTLISASGMLQNGKSFVLKLGYDQKENANGDIIITSTSEENEFPEETFIRFNNNEWISLKEMHEGIQTNEQPREVPSVIGPMAAANLPVVKSSKYGKYTFSNVQWNTTNLMSNNDNNMQIKFQPLFSNLATWKAPNGSTGQLIKKQSDIHTILTRYESYDVNSTYAIAYTRPIVKTSSQRSIPIAISYAGIGTEFQIPIGSSNTSNEGNPARWDLKSMSIPLQDSSGRDLEKYTIQGVTSITGKGKNVKIQAGVYVKIGAFYSFGNKPAQWTTFTDTYTHDITAKVQ
ncbi:hypothetical protein [Paenibacillus sp. AGC30]